jgi:hypothetical protein
MKALVIVFAFGVLAGCSSTAFYGSAAAREGYEYVAGQKNNRGKVWLCPTRQRGDCQEVRIEGGEE